MSLFNSILTWFVRQRLGQIQSFMEAPVEAQQKVFSDLIDTAKDTEFGKKHKFNSINNINDFRESVPVVDYEGMKPWIEKNMKGNQNVLWPSKINWFAKSSGTTDDKSKFIPVSKEALEECHFKASKDFLSIYCNRYPDSKIFSGKGLIMGGSSQVNQLDCNKDSFYGDVSAVMIENMPLLASMIRTPEYSVALMEDWDEKIAKMVETTAKENVTHIAGVPTWTLVLIKKLFEKYQTDNLLDIWPNLELYIHGGVSFKPYRERFKKLIPAEQMRYFEIYNASEGFFAMQNEPEDDGLLLMLDYGVFYEFMPMEELGKPFPLTLTLQDVELNKNYALVISTNAGLWRYLIGDTVKFTSLKPFKIMVSGRTKHFINAFGEEVMVANTDEAITRACKETLAEVTDYTVAPIYFSEKNNGGHEWLIELDTQPHDNSVFIKKLDKHLQSLNSDYEAKRFKDMALTLPKVHFLPKGTFEEWLKSKGKLGGQHKVPRLSNERDYVDEILKFCLTEQKV